MAAAKIEYGSSVAITTTNLASLATSSSRTAGWESAVIDNTSNKYLDILIGGKISTGTSPTAGSIIEIFVYAAWDDTPTYPDAIDGTESTETLTSSEVKWSGLKHAHTITVTATSNVAYPVALFSVAALFGGSLPKRTGLFITHSTGVNLNATGTNHALAYTPVWQTVT